MSTQDAISQLLPAPRSSSPPPVPPPPTPRAPRTSQRARASHDSSDTFISGGLFVVPPPDAESQWRVESLDSRTLSRMSPADLIQLLADLSPEVSRALWDFCRMFNPGWECKALRKSGEVDTRGQAVVDAFFKLLGDLYIVPDVVLNSMIIAGFLRGAFAAELVLDQAGRLPVDLATPDPHALRFRRVSDPVRGTVNQLGQYQAGKWVPLDIPTVGYVPIDRFPGIPYGRSPALPALFAAIFLLGMLHDIRRVVQQQGYPRIDVEASLEKLELLYDRMQGSATDPIDFKEWVDGAINDITDVYASLEPDDTYAHLDTIKVNRPVGTVDSSSLGAIDGLIKGLERMITRALKTMPLLMGLTDSAGETFANRQWELHAAGIKAVQHLLEGLLERLLTVMLQAQGIQATVEFRFAELRASEMLRDAMTEAAQIANASSQYEAGWITQDEAALKGAGKDKADQPAPRRQAAPAPPQPVQGDGDGQEVADDESRGIPLVELRGHNGRH